MVREAVDNIAREVGEDIALGLIHELKAMIDKSYKRPEHVYCVAKKLLKEKGMDKTTLWKHVINVMHQTPIERAKTEEKLQEAVEKKNSFVKIIGYDDVIDIIRDLSNCVSMVDIYCAIQLASGMRQREIFDVATSVVTVDDNNDTHFIQAGFAKKRDKPQTTPLSKPAIGMTGARLVRLVAYFRAEVVLDEIDGSQPSPRAVDLIISRWNHKLSDRTKVLFGVKGERSGTHMNRAIYAGMCCFQLNTTISDILVVKTVLGHKDFTTAAHYLYLRIVPGSRDVPVKVTLKSIDGTDHSLQPFPKRGRDAAARTADYASAIAMLNRHDIPATYVNLQKLGFQQHFVDLMHAGDISVGLE